MYSICEIVNENGCDLMESKTKKYSPKPVFKTIQLTLTCTLCNKKTKEDCRVCFSTVIQLLMVY